MIAAIYVRKSNVQDLPDGEKSVDRQLEHATAYASARAGPWIPPTCTRTTGSPGPNSRSVGASSPS